LKNCIAGVRLSAIPREVEESLTIFLMIRAVVRDRLPAC
jgi:hypothetical protein